MTNTTRNRAEAALLALWLASPAAALELTLPGGARLAAEDSSPQSSYALPVGPWDAASGIPAQRVEGIKSARAWRMNGRSITTLQLLAPLREQLRSAGYEVLFQCADRECGSFDFRFETEVLPGPGMYVNLSDYRFLSARAPDTGDAISLLISRTDNAGFIQIIQVGQSAPAPATPPDAPAEGAGANATPAAPTSAITPSEMSERLERNGHVVLRDLVFASGVHRLGDEEVESLDQLADYLRANPNRRIVLVGHTDATGTLAANVALSRRRAAAALEYLRTRRAIPAEQVSAEGIGFLSPLSSNLTETGRTTNRRIEAVLVSTD